MRAAPTSRRFAHDAMECTFELIFAGRDARRAAQVAAAAFDEVDRLEQLLSRFIPHSEIAQINALPSGGSVRIGPETAECLQIATQLYADTNGALDIAFRSQPEVRAARHDPTAAPLIFDPTTHAVGVPRAGVVLDLGAVGKGYAVDRVVALLRDWGITSALVHSGQSSVSALGRGPDDRPWRVALRNPVQQDLVLGRLDLADAALSGSGQLLHGVHIIDPRTGRPADQVRAAWAIAPTAALADGLSTAFMIMGADEIADYCQRNPVVTAILRLAQHSSTALRTIGVAVPFVEAFPANPKSRI